jgi:hypothetical protein
MSNEQEKKTENKQQKRGIYLMAHEASQISSQAFKTQQQNPFLIPLSFCAGINRSFHHLARLFTSLGL